MIPSLVDDGFTFELEPGVYYRPALHHQRVRFSSLSADTVRGIIRSWPFFWADHPVSEEAKLRAILGYSIPQENLDYQTLNDSVELHVRINPGLSVLDCSTCRSWCINADNGEIHIGASGSPVRLPPGTPVPCELPNGCVKGHYTNPLGLSNARWSACWRYYWKHRRSDQHPLSECYIWERNRLLLDWIVDYGRDRRFDPFVGGSTSRGISARQAEGVPGSTGTGEGSEGGNRSGGSGNDTADASVGTAERRCCCGPEDCDAAGCHCSKPCPG